MSSEHPITTKILPSKAEHVPYTIHRVTVADSGKLQAIQARAAREAADTLLDPEKWANMSKSERDALLQGNNTIFFVAEYGNDFIAIVRLSQHEEDDSARKIGSVFTAAEHRGKSLTRQLLQAAIDEAVRQGATYISLRTQKHLEKAIGTYTKLGFVIEKEIHDNGVEKYVMKRDIEQTEIDIPKDVSL